MIYLLVKYLHIISAVFLFGFGMGSYLYFVAANRTKDPAVISSVGGMVVWFDAWITTTAGVLQVVSGFALVSLTGRSLAEPWVAYCLSLFGLVGLLWLPVLWLQKRLRDMATAAKASGYPLPPLHGSYYKAWLWMGVAGFSGMFLITLGMVTKMTPAGWIELM